MKKNRSMRGFRKEINYSEPCSNAPDKGQLSLGCTHLSTRSLRSLVLKWLLYFILGIWARSGIIYFLKHRYIIGIGEKTWLDISGLYLVIKVTLAIWNSICYSKKKKKARVCVRGWGRYGVGVIRLVSNMHCLLTFFIVFVFLWSVVCILSAVLFTFPRWCH